MERPAKGKVVEVDLDGLQDREVLVRLVTSGLCRSDDHIAKEAGRSRNSHNRGEWAFTRMACGRRSPKPDQ
jgi:D-arabinose 1-dehydrogenase-like Zn-dependent alcohol dehydrogenase